MNERLFPVPLNVFTLRRDRERQKERESIPGRPVKQELIRYESIIINFVEFIINLLPYHFIYKV